MKPKYRLVRSKIIPTYWNCYEVINGFVYFKHKIDFIE